MPLEPVEKLKGFLSSVPSGPITDSVELAGLLAGAWDHFSGSEQENMQAAKLDADRVEKVYWDPPLLQFEIERHSGTDLGSTRQVDGF